MCGLHIRAIAAHGRGSGTDGGAAVTIIVLWVEQVIIVPACQADLDFLLHLECRQAAHALVWMGVALLRATFVCSNQELE